MQQRNAPNPNSKRAALVKPKPAEDAGAELVVDDDTGAQLSGGDDAEPIDWRRASDGDRAAAIADLLRAGDDDEDSSTARVGDDASGNDADDDESAAGGDQETGKKRAPGDFDDLAETLGVEASDLWGTTFRDAAGKTQTLGALKDLLAKDTDLETREHQFAERKVAAENELLRAQQDLNFIVSLLPEGSVKKQLRDRAATERERVRKAEETRMLEVTPEWKNAAVRDKEMDGMSGYLESYGFNRADLDRITDHRLMKMVRDSWQRAERVARALAKVEEKGKGKGVGKQPAKKSTSARREPSVDWRSPKKVKLATVTDLLVNGDKRK